VSALKLKRKLSPFGVQIAGHAVDPQEAGDDVLYHFAIYHGGDLARKENVPRITPQRHRGVWRRTTFQEGRQMV
jgi:hypothetical protein